MASYAEDLARWRAERKQQEVANRVEQIRTEHAQAARERDQAIAENDLETAAFRDDDCQQLEAEYNQYLPPQPTMSPQQAEFLRRQSPFIERHGQTALDAIRLAHNYAVRPRNPNATNPQNAGMGLQPNTQAYFDAMKDLLEMYAKDYGLRYDRSEEVLTPNQAARASGVSAQTYNQSSKELAAQGRFSFQQKR
jgi:hypothetical protein